MVEVGGPGTWTPGRVVGGYARWVVRLRWVVLAWWALAVSGAVWLMPGIGQTGGDLGGLLSVENPAVRAEIRSFERFGLPLLSRVAVVQRDPDGLTPQTQAQAVLRAAAVTRGEYPDAAPIMAAIPVPNTFGAFPGSRERGTTVITLLFTPPDVGFAGQLAAARRFVVRHFTAEDHVVGVTGSVPARVEQGRLLASSLPAVETATFAAVLLIVALAYRSLLASLVSLAVTGVAILLTVHLAGALGDLLGMAVPAETQPLLVALLLGVVTDYVVFYLSGLRHQVARGASRLVAAERATARFTPIVAAAGVTVAAGTGVLVVARFGVFQAFGPGMALAVLIGLVVAVTLVPALLAVLGPAVFWPSRPGRRPPVAADPAVSGRVVVDPVAPDPSVPAPDRSGRHWVERLTRRRTAAFVLAGCTVGLLLAAMPVRHLALGMSFVPSLPEDNSVRRAAVHAQTGFAEGILSPTVLLVESPDIVADQTALARLQRSLSASPGIAGVLGPADLTQQIDPGVFLAPDGSAARYLLVLADDPLGARAIGTLDALRSDLPGMLRAAGLGRATVSVAGDTAIAATVVERTVADLGRITVAALVVNLLLLVLFLRAVVAPLYLLTASVLALAATLGLTTLVFQDVLGNDGLTFYVPFAVAVLLVALGSDYNIFGVGHVWEEARYRPLRQAIVTAVPQSSRAITVAGITLAVSFGLLAIVPLRQFQEIAFAMSVGILIDAIVVRSLVVPSLLTLVGPVSGWPGGRLAGQEDTGGGPGQQAVRPPGARARRRRA